MIERIVFPKYEGVSIFHFMMLQKITYVKRFIFLDKPLFFVLDWN